MSALHDASYKLLFSHRQMIQSLLQDFVREAWVARLDFATLEKVPAAFIAEDRRARDGDLIWRVRAGSQWVYLLVEFQSRADPRMALRIASYLALLYQDLLRQRAVDGRATLPPVVPLVLYRGASRWKAARELAELIAPLPGGGARYRPGLRYRLFDQQALVRSAQWLSGGVAAAFFQLECCRTPGELEQALQVMDDCAPLPEFADLRRDLVRWLKEVLIPTRLPDVRIVAMSDIREMRTMLEQTVERWIRNWQREGRAAGRREGFQQGRQAGLQKGLQKGVRKGLRAGRHSLLAQQLAHRFGPLPEAVRQRLASASPQELDRWALALLDAPDLPAVFGR